MSLYADYLKERTNDRIVESPDGFVTYRYINDGTVLYIVDIYVVPEKRRSKVATELADLVAEEARSLGISEMLGTVVPSTHGATASLKALFAYGMELHSADRDVIILRKGI